MLILIFVISSSKAQTLSYSVAILNKQNSFLLIICLLGVKIMIETSMAIEINGSYLEGSIAIKDSSCNSEGYVAIRTSRYTPVRSLDTPLSDCKSPLLFLHYLEEVL